MRLFLCATLVVLLIGCSNPSATSNPYPVAQEDYPFEAKVVDYIGAVGVGAAYYLSRDSIVVTVFNDFGKPPRELLNRPLTEEERGRVIASLDGLDVASLQASYVNPKIYDGTEMWFDLRIEDRPEKTITLKNVYVKELFDLAALINGLLPQGTPKMLGGRPAASHG